MANQVKKTITNRWQVVLEGLSHDSPEMTVNSIDGSKTEVKLRLGTTERIVPVNDLVEWMAEVRALMLPEKSTR